MELFNIKDIISVEEFRIARPDFATNGDDVTKSAINSSATLLDSKCYGLITRVWEFNLIVPISDREENPLYRTPWELGQIKEAFIAQTQYSINLGNDWGIGSESFSMGGINGSFQRPADRSEMAPGVANLLQNARVFQLQNIFNSGQQGISPGVIKSNYLTREQADLLYFQLFQPAANPGQVVSVDTDHIVSMASPSDLDFKNYTADKIKNWTTTDYLPINKVTNLAFYGKDLYGPNSAVTRGEILNHIAESNQNWTAEMIYKKDDIIKYGYESILGKWMYSVFLALRDNVGKNPLDNPLDWQALASQDVDIVAIINQATANVVAIYDPQFEDFKTEVRTDQENFKGEMRSQQEVFEHQMNAEFLALQENLVKNLLPKMVQDAVNALPTIENVVFAKGTKTLFNTAETFQAAITLYSIAESDYQIDLSGSYLKQGAGGGTGGDAELIIEQRNLPNVNLPLWSGIGGGPDVTVHPADGTGYASALIAKGSTGFYEEGYGIKLNPNQQSAIKIEPRYKEVYIVTWLKDIIQIGAVKLNE